MKCEACEFYQGDNHCWVNHKAIDLCPEAVCDKFKFERVVGEHVAEERARCLAIVEACALEFSAEILDAPYRIQTTEEARRRHTRVMDAARKIRGDG